MEIIQLQVGSCGNTLGTKFWECISEEHGIDRKGEYIGNSDEELEKMNVFYNEDIEGKYVPRCILIDLKKNTLDEIENGEMGELFKKENYISENIGGENNWARGHYTEGGELMESVLNAVRLEMEISDHLQGFQISHSLGGGTGSGLGTLILAKLKEEYPQKLVETFSVFPSQRLSDCVREPYNFILSANQLIENADGVFVLDNEALYDICTRTLQIGEPEYRDLNGIYCNAMSGITSSFRFPVLNNSHLRELLLNLTPFPRLHFLYIGQAPLTNNPYLLRENSVRELWSQMIDAKNSMCAADPRHGRYLAACAVFRGSLKRQDIYEALLNSLNRSCSYYVEWIADNLIYNICNIRTNRLDKSATYVGNSTSMQEVFKRFQEQFTKLYRKRTSIFAYSGEGLDEMEFGRGAR